MYASAPVQDLRGSDATLLEVQIPEMLRRPLGQVHILNVFDLMALATTEGCPKGLVRDLRAWSERMERQIRDLPRGASFDEFVRDVAEIDGGRVPESFRQFMLGEGERRGLPAVVDIVATWAAATPEPFAIGVKHAKMTKAEMVTPRKRSAEPSSAPREDRERGESAPREPKASSSGGGTARGPKPVEDIERRRFLEQLCLERLAAVSDKGLGEPVLVASVKHLAKDRYDDVNPR